MQAHPISESCPCARCTAPVQQQLRESLITIHKLLNHCNGEISQVMNRIQMLGPHEIESILMTQANMLEMHARNLRNAAQSYDLNIRRRYRR